MIGLALVLRWWRERFAVDAPDPAEIEPKYREHDRKIAEVRETTQQVRRWRLRLAADGASGNPIRDMVTGDYRPRHGPEAHP